MLTLPEVSNILTELKMPADPETITRWIEEGQLRAEHSDTAHNGWLISEEALLRLIRRHVRNWHEQNELLQQKFESLKKENESLKLQLGLEIQRRKDLLSKLQVSELEPGEMPF